MTMAHVCWSIVTEVTLNEGARMRTVEEHLATVLAMAERAAPVRQPVSTEPVVLADDLAATLPVPPFDNSAMDGFAVRAADVSDVPTRLRVVGDIPAGTAPTRTVHPGEALRIMTGAPMPEGADAVVPVEDTDQPVGDAPVPAHVEVRASVQPGRHVRRMAEDVGVGDVVLRAGTRVSPAVVAAAISVGVGEWSVIPRPRVAVLSTGSELVAAGVRPGPGQIPDSNGPMLAGLVEQFGGVVTAMLRVDDDPAGMRAAMDQLGDVDVVVTTGGVSAGAFEVVRQATGEHVDFVTVAMQPGKPQGIGRWSVGDRQVPLLAFPGNPVSVFVSSWLFLQPLIGAMQGLPVQWPSLELPAAEGWRSPVGRRQYAPVRIVDGAVLPAHRLGSGSHLVASLHLADGLAVVPQEVERVEPGDVVRVHRTDGAWGGTPGT